MKHFITGCLLLLSSNSFASIFLSCGKFNIRLINNDNGFVKMRVTSNGKRIRPNGNLEGNALVESTMNETRYSLKSYKLIVDHENKNNILQTIGDTKSVYINCDSKKTQVF